MLKFASMTFISPVPLFQNKPAESPVSLEPVSKRKVPWSKERVAKVPGPDQSVPAELLDAKR